MGSITGDQRNRLEQQVLNGKKYEQAYPLVKDFVADRVRLLFDAFVNCDVQNVDALKNIKLQMNTAKGLEEDFISFIHAGRNASDVLSEVEDLEKEIG